tara:strand:+ start:80 stop:334 length:255 start_codon:yes stop_codon:yes gene_type:complete
MKPTKREKYRNTMQKFLDDEEGKGSLHREKLVAVYLKEADHQRFKTQASDLEIPMSSIVRILIKAWLNEKITIQVSVNNTGKAL